MTIGLRLGFEIELLAPPHASRLDLARALAAAHDGSVRHGFHLDAEPSKAPGVDVFHHLTPAFTVVDGAGTPVCTLVDDVTIQDDLDRLAAPQPGWYRIVSDDRRLLRLAASRCDPAAPIGACLAPLAELFGTDVRQHGGFFRVDDDAGATVAIAAPLPGERHRPCEIVTPPIAVDHAERLDALLRAARDLRFTVPSEAAVHLHADGDLVRDARTFRNLVRLHHAYGEVLRWMVGTNPRCRRLGPLPATVLDAVEEPGFGDLAWADARARLLDAGLSKHLDLNLRNVVTPPPGKDTVEWRILPGAAEAGPIVDAAELFERLLRRAAAEAPPQPHAAPAVPGLDGARQLLAELGLVDDGRWLRRQVLHVELPG